jgi:hypothetical protein
MTMRVDMCPECQGRGQIYVEGWVTCMRCSGTGQITSFENPSAGAPSGGGGGGRGGSYELEAFSETIRDAIPGAAHWVLAGLGALAFLAMGINQDGGTGYLVFMAAIGGAIGLAALSLLIFVFDLAIKLVKLAAILAIAAAGLAVVYFVAVYFFN